MVDVLRAAFSGKYGATFQELREFFTFHCGLAAYTGTNDGREISRRVKEGDKQAELAYRGMAYQVAKEIGAASAVLQGKVDAVLLTGGFAYDSMLMAGSKNTSATWLPCTSTPEKTKCSPWLRAPFGF